MKIPLLWLKDYIDIKKSPQEIARSFTALGLMLDKLVANDILDLEHRFDRSDWLSIIGCARDLSAMEGLKLKYPKTHTQKGKPATKETLVNIKVNCPDLVYRFNTKVFKNIKVKESPQWLKDRLEAYGMPSINNIVDITNYVMVEYGQPMHAQDLSKFQKREIVIRRAENREKITTLEGTEINLDNEMFILTQNNEPIAIGGIVGGAKTAINQATTEIILDAGNYDQSNIRKTARKIKIQNETVLRFDKFLHPNGTQIALERAAQLILELADGDYYENTDYYPNPKPLKQITMTLARLQKVSGMTFKMEGVKEILTAIDYKILEETKNSLKLEIPYFRTDVEVEDDIVSDVLRLSDYENIPLQLIDSAPPKEITPPIYKYEEELRDALVNLGLHEHITDPITSRNGKDKQVVIQNSENPEKIALRTSIYDTLLPIVQTYKKRKNIEISLFEIGKIYSRLLEENNYEDFKEDRVVQVIYENTGYSFYESSKKLKELLSGLFLITGIENIRVEKVQNTRENIAKIYIDEKQIGEIKYDSFWLYTEKLMTTSQKQRRVASSVESNQYEDISVTIQKNQPFGPIYDEIKSIDKNIASVNTIDEYFEQNERTVTIRIELKGTDGNIDVTNIKNKIIEMLKTIKSV